MNKNWLSSRYFWAIFLIFWTLFLSILILSTKRNYLCSMHNFFISFFYLHLLGSIIQKVNKTLDVVRDSFTYAEQTSAIFKFLVDQTQTPNSKVKVATMNYLRTLTQLMEPSEVLTMSNLSSGSNWNFYSSNYI